MQTKNAPADIPDNDTVLRPAPSPDAPSFAALYRDYAPRILTMIHHLVLNEATARDLTQEVFIKVYENLEGFRGESHPYTWIHRIALNHTLNFLKREKRRKLLGLLDQDFLNLFKDDGSNDGTLSSAMPLAPDTIMEGEERDRIVRNALASLPPRYRIPFLLHRFEELSHQEIAATLELSLSAVETRIHRAKKMLIGKLEPWLKDL